MSTSRSNKIEQLFKSLRKQYQPVPTVSDRSVLDHLIYGCVLEDSSFESADEAFAKLLQNYVDYNEIRVTTAVELAEAMPGVAKAIETAQRVKRVLQSIYETRYSFDVEDLKKANLAKAIETLGALKGMTRFVLNFVNQNAFGGHSIPIDQSTLNCAIALELVTEAEAEKGTIPGLERAIPKTKGVEFGQLLHQLGVEFQSDYNKPNVVAVFKELKVKYTPPAAVVAEENAASDKKSRKKSTKTAEPTLPEATPSSGDKAASKPGDKTDEKPVEAKTTQGKPASGKSNETKTTSANKAADSKTPETKVAPAKPVEPTVAPVEEKPKAKVAKKPTAPQKVEEPAKPAAKATSKEAVDAGAKKKVTKSTKTSPPKVKATPEKKAPAPTKKPDAKPKAETESKKPATKSSKSSNSISKKKPR